MHFLVSTNTFEKDEMLYFFFLSMMFGYTSKTVSYAKELISVCIWY